MTGLTEEDFDRFEEVARQMVGLCRVNGVCPSPLFQECPFKHVKKMPEDCSRTMAIHWVALLKRLDELARTI